MIRNSEEVTLPEFYIAGISIRTTNQDGAALPAIGALWEKWMSEGILHQIPGRLSDDIYSIYTDYETDHTGAYTVVLGCKVNPGMALPEGFVALTIPADKYRVNYIEGEMPGAIMEAWQRIWDSGTDRKYTIDFEQYTNEGGVQIYLAII
jgi:predicted transcriptional regulator YdeE